jgi:radical SAM-linked protein
MKVVQHHGAVEIMRGCPNGCRFCHAGIWYRPMRQKSAGHIRREVAAFIKRGGYREISLSSLSTGDYRRLDELLESLNREYMSRHISFQLPSLRVSSFSLPLLEKVSEVRKSGLTFAVETAVEGWQLSINKEVSRDQVSDILREAKKRGWRGSKFYFMVGLPVGGPGAAGADEPRDYAHNNEEAEIVDFVAYVGRRTGMHFNINLGTFVPKPHTPYQWAAQIDEEGARQKIDHVRHQLKALGHKVGAHDPFIAMIEGLLSRGDGRVGELIEEAYRRGCRLDAWTEYLKKDIWRPLFAEYAPLVNDILGPKNPALPLPWDCIDSGLSPGYLNHEYRKSEAEEFTLPCINNCTHPCGICSGDAGIVENNIHDDNLLHANTGVLDPPVNKAAPVSEVPVREEGLKKRDGETLRVLFSFSKQDTAVFLPHLGLVEVFSMALIRAGIPALFSQGFNPLPRIDFAAPLSLGIFAEAEIATVDMSPEGIFRIENFKEELNRALPRGLRVADARGFLIPPGGKKHSVPSLLWGYGYEAAASEGPPEAEAREARAETSFADTPGIDYVRKGDEKAYRLSRIGQGRVFSLRRKSVLARNPQNGETPESYFTVYESLYPRN